jgi:hypothetical protein
VTNAFDASIFARGVRARLAAPAMRWLDAHPASFYTFFFLFCMGLASLFDPLRELASDLLAG